MCGGCGPPSPHTQWSWCPLPPVVWVGGGGVGGGNEENQGNLKEKTLGKPGENLRKNPRKTWGKTLGKTRRKPVEKP